MNQILSRETLEDIFVTALEGGSNYWYYLSNSTVRKVRSAVPKIEEESLSSAVFKAVFDYNVDVPIHDAENTEEILGVLSINTIHERLQKIIDDGYGIKIMTEINEDGDADSADFIFQYLTMGELVFS